MLSNKRGLTPLNIVKTQVNNYEIQAEQFNQAFQAANLIYRLLNKARRWQIINQAKTTFEFFKLPIDLQRVILFVYENVPLSLISDEQIKNVIEYGRQRETLNLHYPNTASNKIQFLQRIGTNIRCGFFAAGQFIPPKEETTLQIKKSTEVIINKSLGIM